MMKRPLRGNAVYVIPNLITAGNLFWGFFAIIKSLNGQFGWAAYAIFLAAVFDMLDGRVARLTKGTSEFGVQFDSLCDAVSFGVAPAFMMFQYSLHSFGRLGWIACFLYMACGVLRLARFNVLSSIGKTSGDFAGLPIPMAAVTVASFIALCVDLDPETARNTGLEHWQLIASDWFTPEFKRYALLFIALSMAVLMVSTVVYRSHKVLKIKSIKPFQLLVVSVALLGVIAYQPELISCLLIFAYAFSGPLEWAIAGRKPVDEDDIFTPHEDSTFLDHKDEIPQD